MSAHGTCFTNRPPITITAMTEIDTAKVVQLTWLQSLNVLTTCSIGPLPLLGMPNSPENWPQATWMPTPVRKPISTVRERKSARNPRRRMRARSRNAPTMSAVMPARAT